MDQDRLQELQRRIAEAVAWCDARPRAVDLEGWLRTESLAPPRSETGSIVVSSSAADQVAKQRAALLRRLGTYPDASFRQQGGRLLLFDPETSLSDGAAAAETSYFFDDDNVPPWDTWLMLISDTPQSAERWTSFDSYLLCWIPSDGISLAQQGIDVNPERCLGWADQIARPFIEELRRTGIVHPGRAEKG